MVCIPSPALRSFLRQCLLQSSHNRSFSSSCRRARNGFLAAFPPSSSPELDAFLSKIRTTIFLPNHIQKMHHDMMYRPSLHQYITGDESVSATVKTVDALDSSKTAEETITLEPRNRKDEIPVLQIFRELLPLLRTREDWMMMPAFLREYRASKRKLKQSHVSKIIRAAARTGQYGLLIEMAKNEEETGIVLDTHETAIEVMLLCLQRGIAGEWSEKDVEKAAKHANAAIWMMKQPNHAPGGLETSQANEPDILGVALALASARSMKTKNSEDDEGRVLQYAKEFIKAWPGAKLNFNAQSLKEVNFILQRWAPAWAGVQLAQKIIKDEEIVKELKHIYDSRLNSALNQASSAMQNLGRVSETRGMAIYDGVKSVL